MNTCFCPITNSDGSLLLDVKEFASLTLAKEFYNTWQNKPYMVDGEDAIVCPPEEYDQQ